MALKSTAVYKGCAAAARGQSTRLVSACMLEPCLEGISSTWTSLMPNCLGWFNLSKRIDWICAYRAHWTVPTPCRPSLEMAFYSQDLSLYFCTYTIKDSITYTLCLFYRWPNPYIRPLWYIIFWRPRKIWSRLVVSLPLPHWQGPSGRDEKAKPILKGTIEKTLDPYKEQV